MKGERKMEEGEREELGELEGDRRIINTGNTRRTWKRRIEEEGEEAH